MTKKKAHKPGSATIALNKRARHEYFIEEEFEAGLALQGWEVKSLRAGKANIGDSYVILKDGEAWLFGANFTPMAVASTHVVCDPTRTRKLLLSAHYEKCRPIIDIFCDQLLSMKLVNVHISCMPRKYILCV